MARPSETGNAADVEQVKAARRRSNSRERRFLAALRDVMATPAGKIVLGERDLGFLARCGMYTSPLHASGSIVYYNVGRQDVGREILAKMIEADEKGYLLLETEMRALATRDDNETSAANAERTEE